MVHPTKPSLTTCSSHVHSHCRSAVSDPTRTLTASYLHAHNTFLLTFLNHRLHVSSSTRLSSLAVIALAAHLLELLSVACGTVKTTPVPERRQVELTVTHVG